MTAWAIVVGINQYGPNSGLRTLHGAVADAVDFADWLLDPQGGDVAPENLFFWTCPAPAAAVTQRVADYLQNPPQWPLIGPDFARAPTVTELVAGIQDINKAALAAAATRLYILFAGHGAQTQAQTIADEPQNCFMAGDFVARVAGAGMINCDDMKRYLKSKGPSEVVIFLDCCRNSLPLKVLRPGTAFDNLLGESKQRIAVCRSAQDEAVAYEVPMGASQPERGAFTQLLTFGLRELRDDADKLTLAQLEDYVTEALKEVVKPKEQVPDFDEKPRPPKIVLVKGPAAGKLASVKVALPSVAAGTQVELRDEADAVVQMLDASTTPVTLALPRGAYSLEQDGQLLKAFNHVGPGTPDVVI